MADEEPEPDEQNVPKEPNEDENKEDEEELEYPGEGFEDLEEDTNEKKSAPKPKGMKYFEELYGEDFAGEGMEFFPPPSDLDLLMAWDSGQQEPVEEEKVEEEPKEVIETEVMGEELESERSEELGEEEPEEVESKKPSVEVAPSYEFEEHLSEFFIQPKEKTSSELQFEADFRKVVEEKMKKIMKPEVEKQKKLEGRTPVKKKRLLITDVDVSGLYPPPKAIESAMSFIFDETDETEKRTAERQEEEDITKYIMSLLRDSLQYDPESIFTRNKKEAIQQVRSTVEEIVGAYKKGVTLNITQKVNEMLSHMKPKLRNTLIMSLKDKLKKKVHIETEEEGEMESETEDEGLKKKKKKVKSKMEEVKKEKLKKEMVEEEKGEEELSELEEELSEKMEVVKEKEEVKEKAEEAKLKEMEEEKPAEEIKGEPIIPYEKIDWLVYLTESERQLAIDPTIKSEMELYIAKRKAELEGEEKALREKRERKLKYRKAKDPQEMLRNLNLNVTMKFVLNTGDTFTCAYRYFLPFGEIKEDLSGIFKVPPDVLIIYRGEKEVKNEETAFDLQPDIEPFESVTFRLLTLDNDRWVLKSEHLELPTPDIITCTVETGKDSFGVSEYKEVVVEIENRKIKKPFVGGWRDCATGVEYHNAFSQSAPHAPKLPWDKRVSRDTQTSFTNTKLIDTTCDKSTQMHRRDLFITTEHDKIITPKPYIDYESWYKTRDIEGKVQTIQRYVRAMILRRFLKEKSEEYRKRKCWETEQEQRRILERENRIKTDIINMTYPKTKADFDMLYALVEKWRKAQIQRISNLKTEAPRKAELCTVLEKEIKLLEAIEVHRIAIRKQQERMKALNFMKKVSKPITWTGYRGLTIKMDTLKTQRARELKELYQSLFRHELGHQDRLELLISIKHALRVYPTRTAEELTDLINQECEMLIRGVKARDLKYLRQRIEHLFSEYFKDPNMNPECAKYDPMFNKEPLRNNILFCKLCHQMKLTEEFSAKARDTTINVCSACQWLHNIAVPRIDLSPYRYILKMVRKDEQKRNCYSSCAFIMQDEDMRFLVDAIWNNRSAISECDCLIDLRMPRWDVNKDWTPWNCILLTELEAKAHLKTKPEDNYQPEVIRKIITKQQIAKKSFEMLVSTSENLRDSGKWANVVDMKEYKGLRITADIPDLKPDECLKLKKGGGLYEVRQTRRKDFGYVEFV